MLLALAAAPVSEVRGEFRLISVPSAKGPAALTISKLDGGLTGYYYDLGARAGELRPKAHVVMMLGLGGGEMLRAVRRTLPQAALIGIDIDPKMVRAAVDEFHVDAFGVVASQGDAFKVVKEARHVDILLVDLFNGEEMPAPLLEAAFWKDCRAAIEADKRLPKGLLGVNVYPEAKVPAVLGLLEGAGFHLVERQTIQGSTVLFAEAR